MTRWRPLLLLVPLLCLAGRSEAITISLSPSVVSTTPGQTFTLDLVVSGLAGGALGSWEVDVLFDDALLSLDAVTFGVDLDGGTGDSLQDALPIGAGVWNLAELSLLSPTELDDQEDSFVLATLEFSALVEGTGAVTLANADAGDAGGAVFPELLLESAEIHVVPEPGTGLLVAGGLLALARWRSARHSRGA